jgi:hypothetical protein
MADFSSPFGGITRIRFKGFVIRRLSHRGSPALRLENKTLGVDVKGGSASPKTMLSNAASPPLFYQRVEDNAFHLVEQTLAAVIEWPPASPVSC